MNLSSSTLPVTLPAPPQPSTTTALHDDDATRTRIAKAGKDYETAFLSIMFGQMMSGVKTSTFGGGDGEDMFKSFMTDALAKSMVRHGGVGLAKILSADMLKLQGLTQTPSALAKPTPGSASAPQGGAVKATSTASVTLDIAA